MALKPQPQSNRFQSNRLFVNETSGLMHRQFYSQSRKKLWEQVLWKQIKDQINNQLKDQLRNHLNNQIWRQLWWENWNV